MQENWNSSKNFSLTCAIEFVTSDVVEKMIREKSTGHKSNALFSYQKPSDQQTSRVSKLLGPWSSAITDDAQLLRIKKALNQVFALVLVPLHLQTSKHSFNCNVNISIN